MFGLSDTVGLRPILFRRNIMSKNKSSLLFTLLVLVYITIATSAETGGNPDPYGVKMARVGNITTEIPLGTGNVLYTIRITNTGSKLDTISLTTEGTVKATLTRNSVTLVPSASTDVILMISEDELSDVGTYEILVTATSKGDPTETATITITTTIFTCGVEVTSVGEVKIEKTEAGTKASYIICITNIGSRPDTATLSTSGDIDVNLSETSVALAAGASTDVTLTIDVDVLSSLLSTPGEYKIIVTANSKVLARKQMKSLPPL